MPNRLPIAASWLQSILLVAALTAIAPAQQPAKPTAGATPAAAPHTRLVYDLPAYELARLVDAADGKTLDGCVGDLLDRLREILGERAVVTPLGGTSFAVDVRGDHETIKAAIAACRLRVETKALAMRVVATDDFVMAGVTFDVAKEKVRLGQWLGNGGKELVLADHRNIDRFNEDQQTGPLAFGNLQWVPHLVEPRPDNKALWDQPFALMPAANGVAPLADATVAVFDRAADWSGGRVPAAHAARERPFLLEYVAINWKELSFTGADLDPNGIASVVGQDGRVAVQYKIRDERCALYGDWSQKYLRKHSAILVDGVIRSAPYFVARIPGMGQISGGFTKAEAAALVDRLRLGDLPAAPVLLRQGPVPEPK